MTGSADIHAWDHQCGAGVGTVLETLKDLMWNLSGSRCPTRRSIRELCDMTARSLSYNRIASCVLPR